MTIPTSILLKAKSLKVIKTYTTQKQKNNKNKNNTPQITQHYALIFTHIPYYTKDHQPLYSEVVFHDCTSPEPLKTINNLQYYLFTNSLTFDYHEQKGITEQITLHLKEN